MPHSLSLPADTTPATARARLTRLQAERYEAAGATGAYVRHLDAAIADARAEYTVAAVTELAALRATLGSALQG
jgi:hypothetical protein